MSNSMTRPCPSLPATASGEFCSRKPGGASNAMRSPGCWKLRARDHALCGILAVEHAVERRQQRRPVGLARARQLAAGRRDRAGDALGRARMGAEPVAEKAGLVRAAALGAAGDRHRRPAGWRESSPSQRDRSRRGRDSGCRAGRPRTPARANSPGHRPAAPGEPSCPPASPPSRAPSEPPSRPPSSAPPSWAATAPICPI